MRVVPSAMRRSEQPDENGDSYLDPAAGHGTFIAGLIEQPAPGCDLTVELVLKTDGDGDEFNIAQHITPLDPTIELLNLSFGGYAMAEMFTFGRGDPARAHDRHGCGRVGWQ